MNTGHTFRRLRVAMLTLGAIVGLGFPSVAYHAFDMQAAQTLSFHVLCIAAGLLVGALNYGLFHGVVARQMREIAKRMRDYTETYAAGELLAPPSLQGTSKDALADMQRAFGGLSRVVTTQLENERIARGVVAALSETVDLGQTCEALLMQLEEICGASLGIVYVRTPAGWERSTAFGVDTTDAPELLDADSPLALAASEGLRSHDVSEELHWLKVPTLLGSIVPKQVHTFPIRLDGEAVALVTYGSSGPAGENLRARISMFEREAGVHIANARLHHQLSELAAIDELTNLLNRRFGQRRLGEAHSLSGRAGTELGVAMFDIDHFKRFNDTHGHAAGDAVLSAVAGALAGTVREYDSVVRWGGEEMLLIAPDTPADAMAMLAERLRIAVESLEVDWQGETLKVTTSVGIATGRGAEFSADALVAHADDALYRAKADGRNRVVRHRASDGRLSLVPKTSAAAGA